MFSGSMVALVTPFIKNSIDFDALKSLIEWQIDSETDGILICGSTGEGLLLTENERNSIISASIDAAKKRVPIIVGCSACWTDDAIRLVKQAESLGADGVLVIAPYYVKPTQAGIIDHFTKVHDNTNIPIIMYNNPGRCAVGMSLDTIITLSRLPRIVALKDSDTNLSRATFIKSSEAKDLTLLSGDDPSLAGYLAHGGDGCISVTANISPYLVKKLVSSWKSENICEFQKLSKKLAPLSEALFVEPNPIPAKYALFKIGLIQNEIREPLTIAKKDTAELIDKILLSI